MEDENKIISKTAENYGSSKINDTLENIDYPDEKNEIEPIYETIGNSLKSQGDKVNVTLNDTKLCEISEKKEEAKMNEFIETPKEIVVNEIQKETKENQVIDNTVEIKENETPKETQEIIVNETTVEIKEDEVKETQEIIVGGAAVEIKENEVKETQEIIVNDTREEIKENETPKETQQIIVNETTVEIKENEIQKEIKENETPKETQENQVIDTTVEIKENETPKETQEIIVNETMEEIKENEVPKETLEIIVNETTVEIKEDEIPKETQEIIVNETREEIKENETPKETQENQVIETTIEINENEIPKETKEIIVNETMEEIKENETPKETQEIIVNETTIEINENEIPKEIIVNETAVDINEKAVLENIEKIKENEVNETQVERDSKGTPEEIKKNENFLIAEKTKVNETSQETKLNEITEESKINENIKPLINEATFETKKNEILQTPLKIKEFEVITESFVNENNCGKMQIFENYLDNYQNNKKPGESELIQNNQISENNQTLRSSEKNEENFTKDNEIAIKFDVENFSKNHNINGPNMTELENDKNNKIEEIQSTSDKIHNNENKLDDINEANTQKLIEKISSIDSKDLVSDQNYLNNLNHENTGHNIMTPENININENFEENKNNENITSNQQTQDLNKNNDILEDNNQIAKKVENTELKEQNIQKEIDLKLENAEINSLEGNSNSQMSLFLPSDSQNIIENPLKDEIILNPNPNQISNLENEAIIKNIPKKNDDKLYIRFKNHDFIFKLLLENLINQDTTAIVNAANGSLVLGGGVAGAIDRAGGPKIQKECNEKIKELRQTKGRFSLENGEVSVTGCGDMSKINKNLKHIIHAVGPVYRGGNRNERKELKDAFYNSFEIADQNGMESISIPPISSGIFGYPKDKCAEVFYESLYEFILKKKDSQEKKNLKEVRMVIFDRITFDEFLKEYAKWVHKIEKDLEFEKGYLSDDYFEIQDSYQGLSVILEYMSKKFPKI